MNPYFAGCFLLTMLAFLGGLIAYANKAGRNSARVRSSQQDAATAQATSKAARTMLEARTNGLRTRTQLLDTLEKGQF